GKRRGGGGATCSRADDHHVAFLAVTLRSGVAEGARGLGQGAVAEPAADLDADPLFDLRHHRVAEGREDLRHQQKLVMEAEAGALHATQEVVTSSEVEPAEAPGEGQPL